MARKRKEMRQIREILRLRHQMNLSYEQIGRSLRISKRTVRIYIDRANKAQLSWPIKDELDDNQLELLLFPAKAVNQDNLLKKVDFKCLEEELTNKKYHISLKLLWNEYSAEQEDGYSYSHFCNLYRKYKKSQRVSMHQNHEPGEKMFIDFAGDTIPIICVYTGEITLAQIFVAVLGYSSYTYAEAMYKQDSQATVNAVVNSLEYFEGSPDVVVPDNMKTAVSKPSRYEPEIARPFEELAAHYCMAVIPARVRRPKDKSKVENEVGHVERSILAPLRNVKFYSIQELNCAIYKGLEILNATPFQKRPESRKDLWEEERSSLQPLPLTRYEYATWKLVKVHPDSHVSFENHFYSVPFNYVGEKLELRSTLNIVEIFYDAKRIASHKRNSHYGFTTVVEHLPESQRVYSAQQRPEYYINKAKAIGPCMEELIILVIDSKKYKEQSFRTCLGILSLGKGYESERLESAAKRALFFKTFSYKSMKSILENGLDKDELPNSLADSHEPILHENIRGRTGSYGILGFELLQRWTFDLYTVLDCFRFSAVL